PDRPRETKGDKQGTAVRRMAHDGDGGDGFAAAVQRQRVRGGEGEVKGRRTPLGEGVAQVPIFGPYRMRGAVVVDDARGLRPGRGIDPREKNSQVWTEGQRHQPAGQQAAGLFGFEHVEEAPGVDRTLAITQPYLAAQMGEEKWQRRPVASPWKREVKGN